MGLFEAIFGKGASKDDTTPKQAYYLNDDDAKSFGNIEYMRTNKTIRRTFAKKKGQTEHMESIRQVSSTKKINVDGSPVKGQASYGLSDSNNNSPSYSSAPTPSFESKPATSNAATPEPPSSSARRKPSSSDMDMFRDMAKKIGK